MLLLCSIALFSQKDSLTKVSGNVLITNNGIDPVPAFALGKPAIMTNLFVRKGHFIYNGQLNYSLDFKPWAVNNWFLWRIPLNEKSYIRVGGALSFFHKRDRIDYLTRKNTDIQITNQYLTSEISYWYKLSSNSTVQFIYWQDFGLQWDGLKYGSFISVSGNFNNIPLFNKLRLNLNPNLFYLNNTAPQRGLFFSQISSFSVSPIPLSVFIQTVIPVQVTPKSDFIWNYGIMFKF